MPQTTTVGPGFALLVFIIILCIAIIVAWYMREYEVFEKSPVHTFTTVLIALGIFITFLFYYSVVELQQQQQKLAFVQETSRVSNVVLQNVLREIKKGSKIVPNFTNSLNPLLDCTTTEPDPTTPKACTEKMVLSYKIFSSWQDVIVSHNFVDFDEEAYITNFLQRANSPQLFEYWKINKINFNSKTQSFGDLLFEYGLPITDQRPEVYVSAAQKLIADPRFQSIIK